MNPMYKGLIFTVLLLSSLTVLAQPKINSPFSRFGIGDFTPRTFPALNGMGYISAAYDDPQHLNLVNPASYAFLSETAFEIGFDARRSNWTEGANEETIWSGNITHLALGFQLNNRINEALEGKKRDFNLGMALGLTPRTYVGYNIEVEETLPDESTVLSNYTGKGGTYTLTWGNALRYKNFGFGINFNYLFGNIDIESSGQPSTLNTYSYVTNNNYSVRGVLWDFGAMYRIELKDAQQEEEDLASRKRIVLGLHAGPNQKFNTNKDFLVTRLSTVGNLDTISLSSTVGEGTYPFEVGLGAHYVFQNKFRGGVNIALGNWSKFTNDAIEAQQYDNSFSFGLGAEYIPDNGSITNYWKRLRYRAGFRYVKDPRVILNNSLTNYGVTFGLGIPVILAQRQASYVNFSLEFGQFGLPETIKESYIKLALGFTLNDNRWFFKRKFN